MKGDQEMSSARTGSDDDSKIPSGRIEDLTDMVATDEFLEFNN